ncbi:MAG: hypothetical protein Q4C91_22935 [Eubacteriales bacterium]|nr:hypothetical protein [Eubacteriales bacterium]
MKNQDKYDAGIIDCCRQDPEELIFFRLRDKQVEITTTVSGNDKTSALTAELIYEIFNKTNTGMRVYKSAVRLKLLTKEMNILYDNLEALKKNPDSKIVLRKLKALLRRESSFAAFKRCYVRENLKEYPQLAEYVAL